MRPLVTEESPNWTLPKLQTHKIVRYNGCCWKLQNLEIGGYENCKWVLGIEFGGTGGKDWENAYISEIAFKH